MYYEARTHQSFPVNTALEAAQKIKNRHELFSNSVLKYPVSEGIIYIVPDGHIDHPFGEVAVILEKDGKRNQIESITAAWIDTPEELAEYFDKAIVSNYDMGEAQLSIDGVNSTQKASFTCGCCGGYFKSTIQQQKKYDQDQGFGICPSCETYYK